jgi:DNA-binding transcriptional LysR family regulator
MELRHLRYFVAVAEELHFRRAAERLHVAQPAVSEQVRKLEAELGVQLFNRTQRSVALTGAGAAMLDEARRVLQQAEVAQQAARNAADRVRSRLRIGYEPASIPTSVPRALQSLAAAMPELDTGLDGGPALGLIDDVRSGHLDAAVVSLPAPTGGLRTTPLGDQGAVAALRAGHDLAGRSSISLERVAPDRLLVLPRDSNRPFYDGVVSICRAAGLSPTLVELPGTNVEQALLAVASGAGMALLPDSVAERYAAPGARFVPVDGDGFAVSAAVVTRRDTEHLPTVALLRALSRASKVASVATPRADVRIAA